MEGKLTKSCGYEPTAAEERLIAVLMNPNHYGKSVTEKCQMADISRDSYYRIMKNQEFTDYYNTEIKSTLKSTIGEVLQATKNFAVRFPGNHQDRKILLEMAGTYLEKQQIEHSGSINFEKGLKELLEDTEGQ